MLFRGINKEQIVKKFFFACLDKLWKQTNKFYKYFILIKKIKFIKK